MAERHKIDRSVQDYHPEAAGDPPADSATRRSEIVMFLLLAVVIWPFVTVAVVGGYGFIVWMTQLILGPPGPPPV
ncbi:periplasmic nitrate reductase, NapE protein [Arenibaculum sp.]|jgi:nitrate reductase NapE|uniref:periplasmic nitrate reductase, NapE protein n=1 Tax=Arenibaculum sp. TaxID=2865862 RepID=UPI002E154604|nr:periplasmic nitrate reductase, NapE protein [Arenibaculum sp.]